MARQTLHGSRALFCALLLFVVLAFTASCGGASSAQGGDQESTAEGFTGPTTTVEAVRPEDVLSQDELTGPPKFRNWDEPSPETTTGQISSGTSAGNIPAVKPFNFGRDPGGPKDKTMYLTVSKLGIDSVPVFDSVSDDKLAQGTIHIPATGFPWQDGANVYIAGHRLGYPDTRSSYVFYDLDKLATGDDITLKDSDGGEYDYKVTEQKVVSPDNIQVMNAVDGKSLVTLQTCTLPDFTERVVVQGELAGKPS